MDNQKIIIVEKVVSEPHSSLEIGLMPAAAIKTMPFSSVLLNQGARIHDN